MSFSATLAVALRALRVNALRSGLTMLGIIIGVAAVITMVAVGAGAQDRVDAQIQSLGSNLIIVFNGAGHSRRARLGAGPALSLPEAAPRAIANRGQRTECRRPPARPRRPPAPWKDVVSRRLRIGRRSSGGWPGIRR